MTDLKPDSVLRKEAVEAAEEAEEAAAEEEKSKDAGGIISITFLLVPVVLLRDWFFPPPFEISEQQYFQPWLTTREKGFWFVLLGWLFFGVIYAGAMWLSHKAVNCLKSWKQNPLETLAWLIWTLFAFYLLVSFSWRFWGDQFPYICNFFVSPPK